MHAGSVRGMQEPKDVCSTGPVVNNPLMEISRESLEMRNDRTKKTSSGCPETSRGNTRTYICTEHYSRVAFKNFRHQAYFYKIVVVVWLSHNKVIPINPN